MWFWLIWSSIVFIFTHAKLQKQHPNLMMVTSEYFYHHWEDFKWHWLDWLVLQSVFRVCWMIQPETSCPVCGLTTEVKYIPLAQRTQWFKDPVIHINICCEWWHWWNLTYEAVTSHLNGQYSTEAKSTGKNLSNRTEPKSCQSAVRESTRMCIIYL